MNVRHEGYLVGEIYVYIFTVDYSYICATLCFLVLHAAQANQKISAGNIVSHTLGVAKSGFKQGKAATIIW